MAAPLTEQQKDGCRAALVDLLGILEAVARTDRLTYDRALQDARETWLLCDCGCLLADEYEKCPACHVRWLAEPLERSAS